MTSSSSGYYAFILRFWHEPSDSEQATLSLRCCLEDVETKARYIFRNMNEMYLFLGRLENPTQKLSNSC